MPKAWGHDMSVHCLFHFNVLCVVWWLIKVERPFLEVALTGLEPKCILAKSGGMCLTAMKPSHLILDSSQRD